MTDRLHRDRWFPAWALAMVVLLVTLWPHAHAAATEEPEVVRVPREPPPPFSDDVGWRWEASARAGIGPWIEPQRSEVRLGLEAASLGVSLRHRRARARSWPRSLGRVFIGDEHGLELSSRLLLDSGTPWGALVLEPTLGVTPVARGRGSRLRAPALLDVYLPEVGVAYRADGGLTPVFGPRRPSRSASRSTSPSTSSPA